VLKDPVGEANVKPSWIAPNWGIVTFIL